MVHFKNSKFGFYNATKNIFPELQLIFDTHGIGESLIEPNCFLETIGIID